MEHSFNVEIAKLYGIEEAVIVNNLFFWIRKNEANEQHFHDGRYWTFNTNKALSALFPYISESKMFRVLKHLEDEDIIMKGNYNKEKFDRTCWYSFTDKGLLMLNYQFQNEGMHFSEMKNGDLQNEVTIPDNKTTDIKHKEDTNVSEKEKSWREDFDVYMSILNDAKNELLDDEEFYSSIEKFYPNVDYDKTIEKAVEMYWGTEEGWKKKRRSSTKKDYFPNMVTTLKNVFRYSKGFVYKERGQVGRARISKQQEKPENNNLVIGGTEYR